MALTRKLRIVTLLLILIGLVGCDQTSKHLARARLGRFDVVALPGGLGELRLAENSGSFLSLGAALPGTFRHIIFTLGVGFALAFLFIYLARGPAQLGRLQFLGLALVLAGGVGNLIDRVTRNGFVTDFVLLRLGPLHTGIFNAADVMVMAGAALLAFAFWKASKNPGPNQNANAS